MRCAAAAGISLRGRVFCPLFPFDDAERARLASYPCRFFPLMPPPAGPRLLLLPLLLPPPEARLLLLLPWPPMPMPMPMPPPAPPVGPARAWRSAGRLQRSVRAPSSPWVSGSLASIVISHVRSCSCCRSVNMSCSLPCMCVCE